MGCGTDAAQFAGGNNRFQDIGGVHGTAAGGTGADHGVNFVNEHNGIVFLLQFLDDRFHARFKVAAEFGTRQHGSHIDGINFGVGKLGRYLRARDFQGQSLGDCGFADTGIADQKRIVFYAAVEYLQGALQLGRASDQGIYEAGACFFNQVDSKALKRAGLLRRSGFRCGLPARTGLRWTVGRSVCAHVV